MTSAARIEEVAARVPGWARREIRISPIAAGLTNQNFRVEVDGTERGVVTAVEANPASDLLVLDTGHLVPLRFVVARDDGRVTIDPPAGLFDLD